MIRNTVWALLSASVVASACASSDPAPAPAPSEASTAVASFALTPACAQCAQDAVTNVCGPAAQACLADPACANAGACVQACAPGDAVCIAACVQQAQQVLDDLAECVVCDECPAECSGMWACTGGGGSGGGSMGTGGGGSGGSLGTGGGSSAGSCDNTGDCMACVACAAQGPCAAEIQSCLNDPMCWAGGGPKDVALECAVCTECPNDCAGVVPPGVITCPP